MPRRRKAKIEVSSNTNWDMKKSNFVICGIDALIAHGDPFHYDRRPGFKAAHTLTYVLAIDKEPGHVLLNEQSTTWERCL